MNRIFIIATALTGFSLTVPAAQAGNAGASLSACYDHVITACNTTNHPQSCASAGMDDCDELHSSKSQSSSQRALKIRVAPETDRSRGVILERAPGRRTDPAAAMAAEMNRR